MVRIILFLLKSLVAIFAVIGLAVVALVAVAVVAIGYYGPLDGIDEDLPEVAVLSVDLERGLPDTPARSPFDVASFGQPLDLRGFLDALAAAEDDPQVKGLVARVGRAPFAMAKAQEVRDAVVAFRAAGKFAIAYADTMGELGGGSLPYYVASAFDEIWMMPSGSVGLDGMRLETPFLNEALDDLGVEPRLAQREEYKGIADMFLRDSLSQPVRENLERLVRSWHGQVAAGIAVGRGVTEGVAAVLLDGGPYLADDAVQRNLLDRLAYWDELVEDVKDRAGAGADLVKLTRYERQRERPSEPTGPRIAVVYGEGPIVFGESDVDPFMGGYAMGAETVSEALDDALQDDGIEAIIFRVNSPGGAYVASDEIRRNVERAKDKGLPVIVNFGDVAASGGYFVAVDAARIVAQPGTVTGSIGVVGGKMVLSGLWDSLGISFDAVQVGENAGIGSAQQDFTPAQWDMLKASLDAVYADFTRRVAAGRNLDSQELAAAAKGRIFSGEDALDRGLVDELGGFPTAVAAARTALGLKPGSAIQLETFPAPEDPFKALFEDIFGADATTPAVLTLARNLARVARVLAPLAEALDPARTGERQLRAPELRPAR